MRFNFVLPCKMPTILDFTDTIMPTVLSGHTIKLAYLKKLWQTPTSGIYSVENYINLLFGFAQMAAILDFTHNAVTNVLSGYSHCSV